MLKRIRKCLNLTNLLKKINQRKDFEMNLGETLLLQVKIVERINIINDTLYGLELPNGKIIHIKEKYLHTNENTTNKSLKEQLKEYKTQYYESKEKQRLGLSLEQAKEFERQFKGDQELFESGCGTY